jgi:prepilin-type N-terminal cleavage/methylation domain-containing protein
MKKAFTLVELLVVIAIMGILAVIVTTRVQNVRVQARNSQVRQSVAQGGKSVELFKVNNDNRVLIVQEPDIMKFCITTTFPQIRCVPANGWAAQTDFNFTSTLFNGSSGLNYGTRITNPDPDNYWFAYVTEDCSLDTVASSGGVHKFSQMNNYVLLARVIDPYDRVNYYNFWVKDGTSGEGSNSIIQVPLPPAWNPDVYGNSQCQSSYP